MRKRVGDIIDLYWQGNVKAAAKQMEIAQNTLYRLVSGQTPNPRANVLAKIAKFSGTTVEYLLTGEGRGPQAHDSRGRLLSGPTSRWFRAVEVLYPERGGLREVLDDLPFGAVNFIGLLGSPSSSGKRSGVLAYNETLGRAQALIVEAWAELLEAATAALGAKALRKILDEQELATAGGFTNFVMFLSKYGLTRAEGDRHLAEWADFVNDPDWRPPLLR
jgi:hypothetical protein